MIQNAGAIQSKSEREYIEMCFDIARSNTDAVERLRHGAVLINTKGSYAKGRIRGLQCSSRSYWSNIMV